MTPPPPPTPMSICPKSYNFLAKVGKLLFWGTSIGIVVPAYYRETVLQFSAIFVEGLIFSPPYYLYVYYYSKVRAFRPMGCTPPVPLRRWLVSSPPRVFFGAPHVFGDVRRAVTTMRCVFSGFMFMLSVHGQVCEL